MIRATTFLAGLALTAFAGLTAGETPLAPGLALADDGRYFLSSDKDEIRVELSASHSPPGWVNGALQNRRNMKTDPVRAENGNAELAGTWSVNKGAAEFAVKQSAVRVDEKTYDLTWDFSHPEGIDTELLCLLLRLPAKQFEGASVDFAGEKTVLPPCGEKTLTLRRAPTPTEGKTAVSFLLGERRVVFSFAQTGSLIAGPVRKGNDNHYYGLRIFAEPWKGSLTHASVTLRLTLDS